MQTTRHKKQHVFVELICRIWLCKLHPNWFTKLRGSGPSRSHMKCEIRRLCCTDESLSQSPTVQDEFIRDDCEVQVLRYG